MLVATTTVTVERLAEGVDPYDAATPTERHSGVPAHISSPVGIETLVGGNRTSIDARLFVDPAPALTTRDSIVDEATDESYRVVWVQRRRGLGLDHQVAGLRRVEGAAGG